MWQTLLFSQITIYLKLPNLLTTRILIWFGSLPQIVMISMPKSFLGKILLPDKKRDLWYINPYVLPLETIMWECAIWSLCSRFASMSGDTVDTENDMIIGTWDWWHREPSYKSWDTISWLLDEQVKWVIFPRYLIHCSLVLFLSANDVPMNIVHSLHPEVPNLEPMCCAVPVDAVPPTSHSPIPPAKYFPRVQFLIGCGKNVSCCWLDYFSPIICSLTVSDYTSLPVSCDLSMCLIVFGLGHVTCFGQWEQMSTHDISHIWAELLKEIAQLCPTSLAPVPFAMKRTCPR